jgi:tRNA pseudouridine55 synthase
VEPFGSEPMETLESVAQAREKGTWPRVLAADWPLGHLPKVALDGPQVTRIMHGQSVPDAFTAGQTAARVRLYDPAGRFLGIGEADGSGSVAPRRLFNAEP